jgi:CheY-like chemotaxis protein
MTTAHVLIVEDDPDGQEVIATILDYYQLSADVASSAEDAIDLLEQRNYDVAVVDLALPNIDGWRLLQIIRSQPRTAYLPCLAITAYHSADVALKAIEVGFNSYLPKPFDTNTFINELRILIG